MGRQYAVSRARNGKCCCSPTELHASNSCEAPNFGSRAIMQLSSWPISSTIYYSSEYSRGAFPNPPLLFTERKFLRKQPLPINALGTSTFISFGLRSELFIHAPFVLLLMNNAEHILYNKINIYPEPQIRYSNIKICFYLQKFNLNRALYF